MVLEENISWLADVEPDALKRIVDALYSAHKLISSITDLDTLLRDILEESKQAAQAEASSLMLYDPDIKDLYFEVALGETGDQQALKREIRLKLNEGIAGIAAATQESINVPDATNDPRVFREADKTSNFDTRSLLAIPLVHRDNLVGVLELVNKIGGGAFTDSDLHVMEMFSGLAARTIVNARLIEENLRKERLAAIGQAVAGLSHYSKNMITGMSGSTELIDNALEDENIDILKRSWPIFKRCTERMSSFVEDMLAFSKPRVPLREPCNMAYLFEEILHTFHGIFTEKSISIDVNTQAIDSPIELDSRGIHRCILNLLCNAAHAVPETDGKIELTAQKIANNDLLIEVADNGPGIPEEEVAKIFEPFYSTKGSGGTGLGLAVTYKIIEEHHGKITVERSKLGGALFLIVIPDSENEQA